MPRWSDRLWSRNELLAHAAQVGVTATSRLITDWVQLGLLDHPTRRGLGQGFGTMAGWPENQWELWKQLLRHRSQVKQIAALCNIPVGLWLYFGDDYVELSQVKRAMMTWVGGMHARGYRDSASLALQFVSGIPGVKLKPSRRKEVQRALVGVLVNGLGDRSVEQLRAKLVSLLSSKSASRQSVSDATLEGHVEVMLARLEAARRIQRGDVPDPLYHWARATTHYGRSAMANQGAPMTLQEMLPNSCLDLTTTVGLSLTIPTPMTNGPDAILNPAVWTDRNLMDRMTWLPRLSPLVLPSGEHPMTGLELEHSVTGQPAKPVATSGDN